MMNYRQTLDYLYSSLRSFQDTGGDAYKPGLERIESLVRLLATRNADTRPCMSPGQTARGPFRTS